MSKEIKEIIDNWEDKFWREMNSDRPYAEHIPEIRDTYLYLRDNVIQPLIDGYSKNKKP